MGIAVSELLVKLNAIPKKKLAQALTQIESCSLGYWYVGNSDGKPEEVVLLKDVEKTILELLNEEPKEKEK